MDIFFQLLTIIFLFIFLSIVYLFFWRKEFTDKLYLLHFKAYKKYQKEVLLENKLYKRFVNDFCNANCIAKTSSNEVETERFKELNLNCNIITELLSERSDLVIKYFERTQFSYEDFKNLKNEFNSTELIIVDECLGNDEFIEEITPVTQLIPPAVERKLDDENNIEEIIPTTSLVSSIIDEYPAVKKNNEETVSDTPTVQPPKKGKKDFKCKLSDNQIIYLVECVNNAHMFTTSITIEELKGVFTCNRQRILETTCNLHLAYFFSQLYSHHYITNHHWQHVIMIHEFFYSAGNEIKLLNSTDLSSALSDAKKVSHEDAYEKINNFIKNLKSYE